MLHSRILKSTFSQLEQADSSACISRLCSSDRIAALLRDITVSVRFPLFKDLQETLQMPEQALRRTAADYCGQRHCSRCQLSSPSSQTFLL